MPAEPPEPRRLRRLGPARRHVLPATGHADLTARDAGPEDALWHAQWEAQRHAVPPDGRAEPHRPRAELGGLAPEDFDRLVTLSWHDSEGPLCFDPYADPALLDTSPAWRRARGLLALVRADLVSLTTYGELPPQFVLRAAVDLEWPASQKPTLPAGRAREADFPALTSLVDVLARADLLDVGQRRPYTPVRLAPAGHRALDGESPGAGFARFAGAVWREPSRVRATPDPFRTAPGLRGVVPFALWALATVPAETPADVVAAHAWPERLRLTLDARALAEATRVGLLTQGAALGLLRLRRVRGQSTVTRTPLLGTALRTTLPPYAWPVAGGASSALG